MEAFNTESSSFNKDIFFQIFIPINIVLLSTLFMTNIFYTWCPAILYTLASKTIARNPVCILYLYINKVINFLNQHLVHFAQDIIFNRFLVASLLTFQVFQSNAFVGRFFKLRLNGFNRNLGWVLVESGQNVLERADQHLTVLHVETHRRSYQDHVPLLACN